MSLKVWLPLNKGNANNQGLLNLPLPSYNRYVYNASGKIGGCNTGYAIYHFNEEWLGNTWSLALWVKATAAWPQYNEILLCKNVDTSSACQFYMSIVNGNIFNIGVNAGDWSHQVSYSFAVNTWYHLAVTFSGSQVKMYINGELKGTFSNTTAQSTGKFNLGIGCRSTTTAGTSYTGHTNKAINDVRIYDHCLSQKEVSEIAKGLVLHYKLDNPYMEGTTNISSQGDCSGWNNSGNATRINNDNTLPNIPITYAKNCSITQLTDGECALTFGRTSIPVPSKTITASVWMYIDGNTTDTSLGYTPFIRSSQNDAWLAYLTYEGVANVNVWPRNRWIKISITFDTVSTETYVYFCTYTTKAGFKFAFNGWQIEEKYHATPYTPSIREQGEVCDSSGYGYNGTIHGNLTLSNDSGRYTNCIYIENGVSNNITGPIILNNNTVTMSIWIKSKNGNIGIGSYHIPFNINADAYEFSINPSGQFRQGFVISGNRVCSDYGPDIISDKKWHMISATYDGNNIKRYVDGVLVNTTARSGTLRNGNCTVYLGIYGASTTYGSKELYQSDARVYTTALSGDDILQLYHTSAFADNLGNLECYEINENIDTKPKIHKSGVVSTDLFYEIQDALYLPAGTYVDTGLHYNGGDTCRAETLIQYASGGSGRDLMGYSGAGDGYWGVTSAGTWERHGSIFEYTDADITKLNHIVYQFSSSTENGNYLIGRLGSSYSVRDKYIYHVRLFKNGVLERDLYPTKRGSSIGLVDALTDTFYTASGSPSIVINAIQSRTKLFKDRIQGNEFIEI